MRSEFWNVNFPCSKYYTTQVQKSNEVRLFNILTLVSIIRNPLHFINCRTLRYLMSVASAIKNSKFFCIIVVIFPDRYFAPKVESTFLFYSNKPSVILLSLFSTHRPNIIRSLVLGISSLCFSLKDIITTSYDVLPYLGMSVATKNATVAKNL